jgi:hypothetical protein
VGRVGVNPWKDQDLGSQGIWHRVVTPVFIPEDAGYFAQAAAVLDLCLSSLWASCGEETAITVVVNAASKEAERVIERHWKRGVIETLIWQRENVGKINALMAGVHGSYEPFVTLTDSDIFFLPGWLEETVAVFNAFPFAGAVSALPVPHLRRHVNDSTWLGAAGRGLLHYGAFAAENDLKTYLQDVNSPQLIPPKLMKQQWAVARDGRKALIGATHMQCTYRREALEAAPRERCAAAMGLDSEFRWMDAPADVKGLWRLSSTKAYVRHMGNLVSDDIQQIALGEAKRREGALAAPRGPKVPLEARLPYSVRKLAGRAVRKLMEAILEN